MPKHPQNRSKPGRSGSITRRQAIAAGGSVLSGVGIYAGVLNSDAFTTAVLERISSISVADDQNAALGLTGFSKEETPTFTNNLTVDLTLTLSSNESTAEFDVGGTGTWETSPTFTIPAGGTETVEMTAAVDQIDVLIEGTHTDGSLSMTRTYEISQADQINLSGNVKSAGNSGKFSFGIQNTGSTDAILTGIRVEGTSTAATRVALGDIFSIEPSPSNVTPRRLIYNQLDIDDATAGDVPITYFDGGNDTVRIRPTSNETVFEFDRFADTNSQVGMKNESVTVTFELSDGSTATFHLQDN